MIPAMTPVVERSKTDTFFLSTGSTQVRLQNLALKGKNPMTGAAHVPHRRPSVQHDGQGPDLDGKNIYQRCFQLSARVLMLSWCVSSLGSEHIPPFRSAHESRIHFNTSPLLVSSTIKTPHIDPVWHRPSARSTCPLPACKAFHEVPSGRLPIQHFKAGSTFRPLLPSPRRRREKTSWSWKNTTQPRKVWSPKNNRTSPTATKHI